MWIMESAPTAPESRSPRMQSKGHLLVGPCEHSDGDPTDGLIDAVRQMVDELTE